MRLSCVLAALTVAACGSVSSTKTDAAVVADDVAMIDAPPECPIGTTAFCEGNGLVTCDGQGNLTGSESCVLGCNTTENRCNKIAPSNNLFLVWDEAAASTDLVLSGAATIDTDAGTIEDASGVRTPLTSVVDTTPVDLFLIKVKSFTTGGIVTVNGTRALVILSGGDVLINHDIDVSAKVLGVNGPGAVTNSSACRGKNAGTGNANGDAGGGGGGFATAGGNGGSGGIPTVSAGVGGSSAGGSELAPLRGGCPGGRASDAAGTFAAGGGGGAIQIASGTQIVLGDNAAILANGGGGGRVSGLAVCGIDLPCGQGEGGGAGGGVLLEAPVVTIAATAGIFANGGGGSCANSGTGSHGARGTTPAAGQVCAGDNGDGGDGGTGLVAPTNADPGTGDDPVGGGGGGAAGRIRVNLPLGTAFTPAGSVSGVLSAGALGIR